MILAGLFGLTLGSGATFAFLYLQEVWDRKESIKTEKSLLKALNMAAGTGTLKVRKLKRNEIKSAPKRD